MCNYKCKSRRGKASNSHTCSLWIVGFWNNIETAHATIIENKMNLNLFSKICSQGVQNSSIWIDQHKNHKCLSVFNYVHASVCHKYVFINGIKYVICKLQSRLINTLNSK